MRRHRSLNICVAGFDHPGVPKRVSAAAKKAAKTASTASSSTPPTSRPSSAVLRESGTFPGSIRRSTTSPAESEPADPSLDALPTSESTENMDDSVLCAWYVFFFPLLYLPFGLNDSGKAESGFLEKTGEFGTSA